MNEAGWSLLPRCFQHSLALLDVLCQGVPGIICPEATNEMVMSKATSIVQAVDTYEGRVTVTKYRNDTKQSPRAMVSDARLSALPEAYIIQPLNFDV